HSVRSARPADRASPLPQASAEPPSRDLGGCSRGLRCARCSVQERFLAANAKEGVRPRSSIEPWRGEEQGCKKHARGADLSSEPSPAKEYTIDELAAAT